MNVSIFGLGYVGAVSAACLSKEGHKVIGVDPNKTKVDLINSGKSPVVEECVGDYILEGVNSGTLRATIDSREAIMESDLVLICVGTPSQKNGSLDLRYVGQVMEQVGASLQKKTEFFVVVLRSTVLPGTTSNFVIPILEKASGKTAGKDFGVCFNPEFLREGNGVKDYKNPPKVVVASSDERSRKILLKVYCDIDAPLIIEEFEIAEMVKYVDNVWHGLKVGFANEIGVISKALGIDGQRVMDIFCKDTKLNISEKYLRPGFAFGGSCLPKDLRSLNYKAKTLDLNLPILEAVLPSNSLQINRAFQMITTLGKRKVGFLGLSFKAGTDDLRESPLVEVVEHLLGKGYEIRIYDPDVSIATLLGANREFIQEHIPHIPNLLVESIETVIDFAETIVVGKNGDSYKNIAKRLGPNQNLIDLVRVNASDSDERKYYGICW